MYYGDELYEIENEMLVKKIWNSIIKNHIWYKGAVGKKKNTLYFSYGERMEECAWQKEWQSRSQRF